MSIRSIFATGDRLTGQCQLFFVKRQKDATLRIHQIYLSFGPAGIYQCKQSLATGVQASQLKTALAGKPQLSILEAAALLQDAWVMNQTYRRVPPIGITWLYSLLDMQTDSLNHRQLLYKLTSLPKDPEKFLMTYLEAMIRQDWAFCYDLSDNQQQEILGSRINYLQDCVKRYGSIDIIKVNLQKVEVSFQENENNKNIKTAKFKLQLFWHDNKENVWFGEYYVQLRFAQNNWLLSEFQESCCRQLSLWDSLHPRNTPCTCSVYSLTKIQYERLEGWLKRQSIYCLMGESDHCLIYQTLGNAFQSTGLRLALLEKELWIYSDFPNDLKKAQLLLHQCLRTALPCVGKGRLPLCRIEKAAACGESLKPHLLTVNPDLIVFDLDNLKATLP